MSERTEPQTVANTAFRLIAALQKYHGNSGRPHQSPINQIACYPRTTNKKKEVNSAKLLASHLFELFFPTEISSKQGASQARMHNLVLF